MASGIYLTRASGTLCWSGTIKSKTEGSWTYVGRNAAGLTFWLSGLIIVITASSLAQEHSRSIL